MKKTYRVKREKDFDQIFSQGKNVANRKFVVYHIPNGQEHFRVGLSVSKKLGNAVTRNTIKRKLRHIIQECRPYLNSEDLVVIARKGVEELDYHELKKNLLHVLKLANIYQEGASLEKET
ncbi:ribonuclease P protein component [Streptococcus cameli]